jgi:hypothetical protein
MGKKWIEFKEKNQRSCTKRALVKLKKKKSTIILFEKISKNWTVFDWTIYNKKIIYFFN